MGQRRDGDGRDLDPRPAVVGQGQHRGPGVVVAGPLERVLGSHRGPCRRGVPDFPLCNKSFNQSYSGNDL
jgi:hypothetical protein